MVGKFGLVIIVMASALSSCTKEKKPADVLDKAQMTNFLIDVYLAEARLSSTIFIAESARHVFAPYEKELLQRRAMSDSTLKKSYQYYLEHPIEMQEIMDAVIDSLSLREQAAGQV